MFTKHLKKEWFFKFVYFAADIFRFFLLYSHKIYIIHFYARLFYFDHCSHNSILQCVHCSLIVKSISKTVSLYKASITFTANACDL